MNPQNQQEAFVAIGWRAIGTATGENPQTLASRSAYGLLPVQPTKLSNGRVAMTQGQIDLLKGLK